jgi:hypothetical protein
LQLGGLAGELLGALLVVGIERFASGGGLREGSGGEVGQPLGRLPGLAVDVLNPGGKLLPCLPPPFGPVLEFRAPPGGGLVGELLG